MSSCKRRLIVNVPIVIVAVAIVIVICLVVVIVIAMDIAPSLPPTFYQSTCSHFPPMFVIIAFIIYTSCVASARWLYQPVSRG